jgi:hypothetical protein
MKLNRKLPTYLVFFFPSLFSRAAHRRLINSSCPSRGSFGKHFSPERNKHEQRVFDDRQSTRCTSIIPASFVLARGAKSTKAFASQYLRRRMENFPLFRVMHEQRESSFNNPLAALLL